MTRCEAQALDYAHFEIEKDTVPLCDEEGTVDVVGYSLCEGCAEALRLLSDIGQRVRGERN